MDTTTTDTAPRIYLACLECYNNGRLLGWWLDADDTLEDEAAAKQEAHQERVPYGHEEYAIHGHEGFGGRVPEYGALADVAAVGQAISDGGPAMAAYLDDFFSLSDQVAAVENFDEAFRGEYDSPKDYAESFYREGSDTYLVHFIDWERVARDLEQDHTFAPAPGGGVFVFVSI